MVDDGFLEDELESEKDRLRDLIDEVDRVLDGRIDVYDRVLEELDEEIDRQVDRLDRASVKDEGDVRGVLADLYSERRSVRRSVWSDCESWWGRRMDLVRELGELEDFDDF